jgi:hypothetical protein
MRVRVYVSLHVRVSVCGVCVRVLRVRMRVGCV